MTADYRNLIEQLAEALDACRCGGPSEETADIDYDLITRARAALAEPELPAIAPVPVSERSPNEEDCDEKGRCWHAFLLCGDPTWTLDDYNCIPRLGSTHWLPANALPLPQ